MAERRQILAEFTTPEDLLEAIRRTRAVGFRHIEAYTPFPIEGLAQATGFRSHAIGWWCLAGSTLGAVLGYVMQLCVNLDYPLDIGGRPVIANPAFMVVSFELLILFGVISAVVAMLVLNGLPRLNHPVFDAERFRLATLDRFFLGVETSDARRAEAFLRTLSPVSLAEVSS